jgi:hypothetical protein
MEDLMIILNKDPFIKKNILKRIILIRNNNKIILIRNNNKIIVIINNKRIK